MPLGSGSPVGVAPRLCGTCGRVLAEGVSCASCAAARRSDAAMIGEEAILDGDAALVDRRYRLESEIGRGGMGVVFLATDTWLGRTVALKMIAPALARNGAIAARFQREAKALASVRSQYVVQVYAFGEHGGSYFFAMEHVRGRPVSEILAEHRKHGDTIPPHRTLTILNRIALGLDAVHAAGILHRDVKPSNILIEEDSGRPVLIDFGLAMPSDDPAAALAMGTPSYMAPEQGGVGFHGSTATARTDLYALGITAYEMLSGVLPFTSTDRAQMMRHHARKQPRPLSSHKPELAPFDKALALALAKDPDDRFPNCTAFAQVLGSASEVWLNSILPTLPPPPPSSRRPGEGETALPTARLPGAPPRVEAAPPAQAQAQSPERRFHVLVVDDSRVFRKFTVQATQIAFFRRGKSREVVVHGACSGQEAITLASFQRPDLVLLDFDMPGFDGVDTLTRLRALPDGACMRVVVLSGRVRAADRWRFTVLGVNDFVSKPIDFSQLVDRLEGIARRYEAAELHKNQDA